MTEEEKIFQGLLFSPGDPELRRIKLRSHKLCARYNRTDEDETALRAELIGQILGRCGENVFFQGPIFFHYGVHSSFGSNVFVNYNFTVQDDARVTVGDRVNFGPNVTIVTPLHPMIASERAEMRTPEGKPARFCWAKPVVIGSDVWICANAVICSGVTIGDGCVIGAGSVVVRDIPANTFAAGNPCRPIRTITDADSMRFKPELLGGCSVE